MSDHYCCKTCGLRYDDCRCPSPAPVPDRSLNKWLVGDNFVVMRVSEFDGLVMADKRTKLHAIAHRAHKPLFETEHEAKQHALDLMQVELDIAQAKAKRLRALLKKGAVDVPANRT